MSILEIKNLTVINKNSKQLLLDNISFSLNKGQILGIVGESGSGKTLTGLSVLNLLDSSIFDIVDGSIIYKDINILTLSDQSIQKIRTKDISIVFQEPMLSLNPVQKISTQITEVIKLHLTRNKIKETGDEKLDYDTIYLHHIKDRTICLFNGPKYDWLYEGFEHYWS